MNSVNREGHRRTYAVTYDLSSLMQAFRHSPIKVPAENDPIFSRFERRLFRTIREHLPDLEVHSIRLSDQRCLIWNEVWKSRRETDHYAVISTRHEITDETRKASQRIRGEKYVLNVNRLFGSKGNMLGYGPRPGFEPLKTQFERIAHEVADRSVILVEDGSITGGTLLFILNKLKELSIEVVMIVIGFCCIEAEAAIRQYFKGELVIVNDLGLIVDWIPDHDLVPFVPNCGRVLGIEENGIFTSVFADGSVTFAYPYILPFGNITRWASLPPDGALAVSKLSIDFSIELWDLVGKLNGGKIRIGDLAGICPRISIPVEIGNHIEIPLSGLQVTEFLAKMRDKLK